MSLSNGGRAPSMVDVAREAGVAHITVSRVLNGHPSVRPETRQRVEEAIAKLAYHRNDLARALRSGRSNTLGVIIAGTSLHELPHVLLGVEEAATSIGYSTMLASWQVGSPHSLDDIVGRTVAQGVEGLVILADRATAVESIERITPGIPTCVVMSGDIESSAVASVEFDQVLGARLATEHLLQLGHQDVVHLCGRLGVFDAVARIDGWRERMRDAGITEPRLFHGDFTARAGHDLGVQLLAADELPSAVFVGNDLMAMGLLAALSDRGVSVPGDVSVVGFDDLPGAEYLGPGLTTVRQDFVALGRRSIEIVAGLMADEQPRHHLIPTELVVRRSTAQPSTASSARALTTVPGADAAR